MASRAQAPASRRTSLVVCMQGVARLRPNVVWREDGAWSHWKPGLQMAKKEETN